MKILGKWMELGNIILREVSQFPDYMKKEDQSVDTLVFLRRDTKYPWENIQRQSVEQRLKERPSRDCPT